MISFSSHRKKQYWKELELLEVEIKSLEKEHFKTRSEGIHRALLRKRNQYQTLTKQRKHYLEPGRDITNWGIRETNYWPAAEKTNLLLHDSESEKN